VTGRRESGDTTVSLIFWARRSSKSLLYNDTHFFVLMSVYVFEFLEKRKKN